MDHATAWKSVVEGKSGITDITLFDTKGTDCPVHIAGEIKNFDPTKPFAKPIFPKGKDGPPVTQAMSQKELRRSDRFIHLTLVAGAEAYMDSGLDDHREKVTPEEIGINIGCGMGGLPGIEDTYDTLLEKGYRRITPFFIPQVIPNLAAGQLSILLNTKNTNLCSVSACASSAHSIGESARIIERGEATVMFAGGTEAVICPLGIGGFAALRALSTNNERGTKASRPFDKDRDGFVMSEGACVLVLEEYEFAKARGARIYAEVAGFGATSDAHHITQPMDDGDGGYRSMKLALSDAGLTAADVQYVNAHGTSTPLGDIQEANAISKLFGGQKDLHVSSTKSTTGHLLGAAGAIEAAFCIFAMRDSVVPPTINLDNLDPRAAATGLNFTPNKAVKKPVNVAISNSFGFGGTNVSLVFKKVNA